MNINDQIVEKYKNKKLIVPDYYSPKKEYYSVEDFVDFDWFKHYLGELVSHEASITRDGIGFLKEAYGFVELSATLFNDGWFRNEFKNVEELRDWFEWLEKNTN